MAKPPTNSYSETALKHGQDTMTGVETKSLRPHSFRGKCKMNKNTKRKVIREFLEWIEKQGWVICQTGQDMKGDYFYSPIQDIDGFIEGFLKGAGK